ncbi:two component transcriptional regulator, AraC family [Ruminiclostridium papyrosolvens DSM 2782]|uniref:Stage 0 sporulation protein A homolog n=1 Tax=Ruminiclostridium papyrosolvens DSM 2782 TaxID=588581 RepID=F1TAD2_9FIRM|nr:response regulator [Ruminiclostridium papyrosolvens]EGD48475.1 two component transcriptional regulator, AraC family [Ruminiclostridium papyrosolvens DSM 2782]WES32766.1 response regulator [Ruminiclostridium papyrosolvens DSM 2782]
MFRLLVVEDEEMIRNKIIYNTNWKEHGFVEVLQASNGMEALDIVRKNNIDIVITDIQMPEMNGIELIREIKSLNRGIKCIIITAYAEFEYAKESVKLNVNDYILKPFKSKDLLDIVKKLSEEINRERNERVEVENLRRQLRENKKALREKLFNDLLSNSYIGDIESDLNYLELSKLRNREYFIAVININNFMELIIEEDEEQKYIVNLSFYNLVTKFLTYLEKDSSDTSEDKLVYSVINYKIDQLVIVVYEDIDKFTSAFEDLIKLGRMELGFCITIGIGNKYKNLTDVHISYREACSAALLDRVYGREIVYIFNDLNFGNKVYSKQLHILGDTKLYDDLKIGAFPEIKNDIVDIITQIKSSKLELDAINTIIYNVVLLSCKTINELGYDIFEIMGEDFNLHFDVKEINNLVQLEEWLLSFFYKVNEYINQKRSNRNQKLLSKVKDYVDGNYSENITLTSISKDFGISSGYLSVLFNDYIGQNFIDYLTNLRIQSAKNLLKSTDLKIYEIADRVGYRDAYYFSTAFKKIVGINPTDYREKLNML